MLCNPESPCTAIVDEGGLEGVPLQALQEPWVLGFWVWGLKVLGFREPYYTS